MPYLIAEMLFYLLVTAVLGLVAGWLAKGLLAMRRQRLQEEKWRRELRQSEARAGSLKNQLAEAFLVEERLRKDLSRSALPALPPNPMPERVAALEAELAQRDSKIETLKLQFSQSEAALASEWQSLNAVKSELAERQQRVEERAKEMSGKLRAGEEGRQQLRLQLGAMQRQGERLQQELAAAQQELAEERRLAAARAAELTAKLEDQETMVALLAADEVATPVASPMAAEEPAPDDLERIRGIGPALHRKLNQIGVTRFRQIAAWTDDDVAEVARRIGAGPGRITGGGWIEAARKLLVHS